MARFRSIRAEDIAEAVRGFVRAGRPRSREGFIPGLRHSNEFTGRHSRRTLNNGRSASDNCDRQDTLPRQRAGGSPLGSGTAAPCLRSFPPALWRFALPSVKG